MSRAASVPQVYILCRVSGALMDCANCGHMAATHVPSPIALSDICLVDDCPCVLYKAKETNG